MNELPEVSVKDCIKIIKSGKNRETIKKYLYNLLKEEKNFFTFCAFILPHAFTKPFKDFHRETIKEFMNDNNCALAWPRGSGKSTTVGLGYLLWLIAYQKKKYVVYTSQNHEKSTQFLEPIKHEIKHNKLFKFLYGDYMDKVGDKETGKDREDCFDYKDMRIQALSFEKNIRGLKYGVFRPDLVILDDIEDDQRVLNPDLRRKDNDKLNKQIIPALDPETGCYKMVGTILHLDSLLVKKLRLLDGKIYRMCELDDKGRIIPETIIFPELFSVEVLENKIYEMGSASFSSEYLNNPVDDTSSIIKREWVKACFDEEVSFNTINHEVFEDSVQGVDFAFSDRSSADSSAFLGVGVFKGVKYLSSFFKKKGMTIIEQFDYIEGLTVRYGFKMNALEENSIRSMSNELKNYSFPFSLYWMGASDTPAKRKLEVDFDEKRRGVSKINIVKRLATVFENSYNLVRDGGSPSFVIPYKEEVDKKIAHELLDECTSWALDNGKLVETGVHPDSPIALALAFEELDRDKFELQFVSLNS